MRVPTNTNDLIERLRIAVVSNDEAFVKGEQLLPERELGAALGVGRRALRGALNTLEGEGLLFRKQGKGTFIREVSVKSASLKSLTNRTSPQDIIEVRLQIEPILAGLSAVRATNFEIDQMTQFIQRAARAGSPGEFEQWDSMFHSKIAESVRNTMFWGVFRLINSVRKEQHWINSRSRVFTEGVSREMVQQHEAILEAIQSRNPDAATDAMRIHIATAGMRIRGSMLET